VGATKARVFGAAQMIGRAKRSYQFGRSTTWAAERV